MYFVRNELFTPGNHMNMSENIKNRLVGIKLPHEISKGSGDEFTYHHTDTSGLEMKISEFNG